MKESTGKDIKHIVYGNALHDIFILGNIVRIETDEVFATLLAMLLEHIEKLPFGILKNSAIYKKRYLVLNNCKKIVKDIQSREYKVITWSPMSWITFWSPVLVSIFYFILVSISDVGSALYNINYRYFETDSLTDTSNDIGTSFNLLNMGGGFFYYFFISLFLGWIIGNIIQNSIRGRVFIVPLYLYVKLDLKPITKAVGKVGSFIHLFLVKVRALHFTFVREVF